jgi:prolyl oligopeptidase
VRYPRVLLTTGATDPRVEPWQIAKLAAALQAAGTDTILRVDFDAGHGVGSTRAQRDAEMADTYAFVLDAARRGASA